MMRGRILIKRSWGYALASYNCVQRSVLPDSCLAFFLTRAVLLPDLCFAFSRLVLYVFLTRAVFFLTVAVCFS